MSGEFVADASNDLLADFAEMVMVYRRVRPKGIVTVRLSAVAYEAVERQLTAEGSILDVEAALDRIARAHGCKGVRVELVTE